MALILNDVAAATSGSTLCVNISHRTTDYKTCIGNSPEVELGRAVGARRLTFEMADANFGGITGGNKAAVWVAPMFESGAVSHRHDNRVVADPCMV